jgi:hypothetical protein
MFIFAGFAWAIWTTRNKMAIEQRFPKALADVIYVALSLLQTWSVLLNEVDRQRVLHVRDDIMNWMKSFTPNLLESTDIFEI